MQCTNYLASEKLYARILDKKVRDITEAKVLEEQEH